MLQLQLVRSGRGETMASCDAAGSARGPSAVARVKAWLRLATIGVAGAAILAACGGSDDGGPPPVPAPTIKSLSTRADMVSGGDALLEIGLPSGVAPAALTVNVGGRDVTAQFAARASAGNRVIGLVTGLTAGNNVVTASAGGSTSTLTINNHAIGGPIISGPQILPWVCATPTAQAASGDTPATNASGLIDERRRCPVQHRDRVQAVLPDAIRPPAAAERVCPIPTRARDGAGQPLLQDLTPGGTLRPTSRRPRPTPASRCRTSSASSAAR